jgi:hypothetical protein
LAGQYAIILNLILHNFRLRGCSQALFGLFLKKSREKPTAFFAEAFSQKASWVQKNPLGMTQLQGKRL